MGFKEEITTAMQQARGYRESIEALEATLAEEKQLLEEVETDTIPSIFHEYGFSEATLDDGTKVKLKSYVSPKVVDDSALYAWLEANGMGAVIKDQIDLGKGQFDAAIKEFLEQGGYEYSRKTSVHPQTLKATVSRLMEQGEELPPENVLTISVFEKAEIKLKKE